LTEVGPLPVGVLRFGVADGAESWQDGPSPDRIGAAAQDVFNNVARTCVEAMAAPSDP
jgi:hypothetical protein